MTLFTVAIPTYNGEHRIPQVLDRLRQQIKTELIDWEVIVVDNNSVDQTAKVVQGYQKDWLSHIPLRYCLESQQGAAFARQRAIESAQSELIGFLDDDNIPALDWVYHANQFAQKYPEAGAFGGKIHGKFEVNPPENFQKIACFLALVDRGEQPIQYHLKDRLLPPGAGLIVRKKAWLEAVPKRLVLNHKGRDAKLASEDLEAILHIQKANWQVWYNPQLKIEHHIPSWRLEQDYLLSVICCVGLSRYHLRMLRLKPWQRPLMTVLYLLKDFQQLLWHILKFPRCTNLIESCERQLLISTLGSPFFLFKNIYFPPQLPSYQTPSKLMSSVNSPKRQKTLLTPLDH